MNLILGAVLIVAAVALVHVGRLAVERVAVTAPARESLVADLFAVTFAAIFGPGVLLLARELTGGLDPLRIVAFAATLGAAFLGARLVSATVRRSAARPAPARIPTTPAPLPACGGVT